MTRQPGFSIEDAAHLERARRLGREGWGRVHPNPMVGCVVVREGRTVGEGYHQVFGGPHAEVVALEAARGRSRGATAYVSLEPCNHQGKTPPCTRALLDAGVTRVVFGASEPGSVAAGGAEALRRGGVEVVGPIWDEAIGRAENPAFFHIARHHSPFVALKLAMTLDAKIAARPGVRTQITGSEVENEVHRLRAGFDAVMVGDGTVRADDPRLTVRSAPAGRVPPRRVILDPIAALDVRAAVFQDAQSVPVHVFTREDADGEAVTRLQAAGAHVHRVRGCPQGVDPEAVMRACWDLDIRSIFCEGGARLAASLLREGRVHRLYLFVAPRTFGAVGVPAFPDDADGLAWEDFRVARPPTTYGRDTSLVLDRQEA